MSEIHSELRRQSLQRESEEEEEEDLISLQIGSNTIYICYSLLSKYSKLIREKYLISDVKDHLSEDIEHLQQETNLNEENIITFLQYFRNQPINITNDNFRDIYKLSEFFQVKTLLRELDKYKSTHSNSIVFFIRTILDEISMMGEVIKYNLGDKMKKQLSEKVNECLQNKIFGKLPVYVIYEVLSNANKSKMKSDLLLDFINQSKNDRFILFTFLDLKTLSDNKFNELYEDFINSEDDITIKNYQYLPCNLGYIKSLKDEKAKLQETIEETNNHYQMKLKQKEDEIINLQQKLRIMSQKYEKLHSKFDKMNIN